MTPDFPNDEILVRLPFHKANALPSVSFSLKNRGTITCTYRVPSGQKRVGTEKIYLLFALHCLDG